MAQTALDIGFEGIHLESHINPDKALSDAKQQITPEAFGEMISILHSRESLEHNPFAENQLEILRGKIDSLDNYLLELLSERMDVVREIADYKRENNLAIVQPSRWTEILESRLSTGERKHLTQKFIKELFHAVHKESIHHQTEVMLTEVKPEVK